MLARKDIEEFEEDFDVKSFFKSVKIFDDFPVIDDIVMTYRNYQWITPYVKYLLSPRRDTEDATHNFFCNYGMPGAGNFLSRIIKNSSDSLIKKLAEENLQLLTIWDDFHKIKTRKKFFVESALGSIQNRVNLAIPITIQLFQLEIKRLGWNLENDLDEELNKKFPVLLYEYKNEDGTPQRTYLTNLRTLKELIKIQI